MADRPRNDRFGFFPEGQYPPNLRNVFGVDGSRRRFLISVGFGAACVLLGSRRVDQSSRLSDQPGGELVLGPSTDANGSTPSPGVLDGGESASAIEDHVFETVIVGGRVIDPETGFDQRANIGIDEGRISQIVTVPLQGKNVIVADNKVVAPGFVDLLSYEPNSFGVRLKILDGVTTNLAMHGVSNYGTDFFEAYEGQTAVNFGAAFHHHFVRGDRLKARPDKPLNPEQLDLLEQEARQGLEQGFSGISFSPEYSPGTSDSEIDRLAAVAAEAGHVCFFHVRHSGVMPKDKPIAALQSAIQVAHRFGVAVHIEHITSTGGTAQMGKALDLIESARNDGADVTACFYPYDYWGTFAASSRFAEGWQERFNLSYDDLQVAGSDERLTEATFRTAQRKNLLVAARGSIPAGDVRAAFGRSWTIVASDAITTASLNNHPRGAGTFARTLGVYVRDLEVVDLVSALAKMTFLPAKRVESMIPEMARKGRLQPGSDADVVIFDPGTIRDTATVRHPGAPSLGVSAVLVGGTPVVANGEVVEGALPGKALRSA